MFCTFIRNKVIETTIKPQIQSQTPMSYHCQAMTLESGRFSCVSDGLLGSNMLGKTIDMYIIVMLISF